MVDLWFRCGWVGVDLFFVLSGFLVSGLVFEEWKRTQGFAAGRFLIRRGFKIYPAFYLLWLMVLLGQWFAGRGFDVARLLNEFIFIQNYAPAEWRHTWSLAVEEHFYLGLALFCWLRVRATKRTSNPFLPIIWLGVASLFVCPMLRWQASADGLFDLRRNLFPTHLRIDSLMFGVILSWFWAFKRDVVTKIVGPRRVLFRAVGLALLTPTLFFSLEQDRWMHVFGFSLFAGAGVALIISALTAQNVKPNSAIRFIATIGFYSYSIYLWHLPFVRVLDSAFAGKFSSNTWLAVYLIMSVTVGIVMGKLVEWPMLHLRDKWFPHYGKNTDSIAPLQPATPTIIQPQP